MELGDETPEDYDQSTSYVRCPHATLKLKIKKDGGWFVCQNCGHEFQVIAGARKAGASSI
jgi:transcription elongation factor Elf1